MENITSSQIWAYLEITHYTSTQGVTKPGVYVLNLFCFHVIPGLQLVLDLSAEKQLSITHSVTNSDLYFETHFFVIHILCVEKQSSIQGIYLAEQGCVLSFHCEKDWTFCVETQAPT